MMEDDYTMDSRTHPYHRLSSAGIPAGVGSRES